MTNPTAGRPTPFQVHHWYWGALIGTGGFILLFWHPGPGLMVGGVGLWIMADDLLQHFIQHWKSDYLSPWHRWFYGLAEWMVAHAPEGSRWRRFLERVSRL